MIKELPVDQRAPGKPVASGQLDKQEILTQPPLQMCKPMTSDRENLLQDYERRFEKLPEDQKLSKLCSEAGLRLVEVGQFFHTLPSQSFCREYTLPRDQEGTRAKGWIQSNVRFGPVPDIKSCKKDGKIQY